MENLIINSVTIESSGVIQYAQDYFDCESIEEIEMVLDEYNNVYWPSRLFLGDIMTKFDLYEEKFISYFTLALLEDTGYLHVKENSYYTGGLMRFGKKKKCEFLLDDCSPENTNSITFSNEFYLPTETNKYPEPSCSSSRLAKTVYVLHEIKTDETIPSSGYNLNGLTGVKKTNYCPIAEYQSPSEDLHTGFCSDEAIYKDDTVFEELGSESFCVLSSLISNNFKSVCYKMSCSEKSLTIKVNNDYIVCPQEGGQIKPKDFTGYLLCPDYNLICSAEYLCNDLFDCFNKNSKEKYIDYDSVNQDIKRIMRKKMNVMKLFQTAQDI